MIPFLFETLKALKKEKEYTRISGKLSSIGLGIPVALSALVPFLVAIDFTLPFAVALVIDVIGLIAAFSLVKPPIKQKQIEEVGITNFREVMHAGYKLKFFRYAFFFGILGGILTGANAFRAPYQEFVGISVIYLGVLFGIGRLAASLLLAYSGKFRKFFKNIQNLSSYSLLIFPLLVFGLGSFTVWWAVAAVFILINAFLWGTSQVRVGFLLDIIQNNHFKATLLSVNGQIYSLFAAASGFIAGLAVEFLSYQASFFILAIILIALLLPSYILILKDPRISKVTE